MGESARAIIGSPLLELRSAYSHSIPATTSESITLKGKDEDDEEEDEAPLYSQSAQVVGLKFLHPRNRLSRLLSHR